MMPASVASWREEADAREGATTTDDQQRGKQRSPQLTVTDMGLSLGTAQPDQGARAFTGLRTRVPVQSVAGTLTTRESFAGPQPKGRPGGFRT